jgi:two-component system, cell cycle sensor histidine kinase and response regulator CckA
MTHQTIKILLVEDNPGDVLLLQETLSEISLVTFALVNVERLSEALKQLQTEVFDVILLDLALPDSQGLESFAKIYQQVPLTPIVVLTGISDETTAIKAMQAGAQDYLVKGRVSGGDLLLRSIRYAIERKRAEAILQKRERELRTLTEHAPDIISRFDQDLKYLFINAAVEAATGINAAAFLGKTARELDLPITAVAQWETTLNQVFATGEATSIECEVSTPQGMRHYQSRCVPEFALDGSVESVLVISRDTTEQKQLEAQLFRAQRMESLGTLASGIAHDMNNILTPILVVSQLLPLKIPNLDQQNQHLLKMLEDSAKRGSNLVKQILTFSRGVEGERSPVQIEVLLAEIEQILKSTFSKSIRLIFDRSAGQNATDGLRPTGGHQPQTPHLWPVLADATQLHQVLMNLCVNARDAIPNQGSLSISAENRILTEADARINIEAKPGAYVVVTIADTGIGIAPEYLDRIFEPFFTTKEVGKGTGLGLATAIGIIKSHRGFVTVSSEVGNGTKFQVFLPAIIKPAATPEPDQQYPTGNGELLLVVDDEARIREALKITLELYNYRVIAAEDGIEAIKIYTTQQQEISAILIDMIMPLMDGDQTIRALYEINPNNKVIVFSGTATKGSLPPLSNVKGFLSKPYTTQDLLTIVHNVVSQA